VKSEEKKNIQKSLFGIAFSVFLLLACIVKCHLCRLFGINREINHVKRHVIYANYYNMVKGGMKLATRYENTWNLNIDAVDLLLYVDT